MSQSFENLKPFARFRKLVSGAWIYTLGATSLFFIIGLEISVFGYVPGTKDPQTILTLCWASLFAGFVLMNLTYVFGFAHDIEMQKGVMG